MTANSNARILTFTPLQSTSQPAVLLNKMARRVCHLTPKSRALTGVQRKRMDYPSDATFSDIGAMLSVDFAQAHTLLDHMMISKIVGRIVWDIVHNNLTQTEAIMKQRKEWRRTLGLPPLTRDAQH